MQTEQVEVKRKPGRPVTKKWDEAGAKGRRTTKAVHDDSIHSARAMDERAAVEVHELEDELYAS